MSVRQGITTLETVVALGLLGAVMLTTQTFYNRVLQGRALLVETNFVQRTLSNARAEIAAWPVEQLTVERLGQLPIESPPPGLVEPKWIVEVRSLQEPIGCQQVSLAIQWQARGERHTSPARTFWLPTQSKSTTGATSDGQ